jgi:hypothetical protein
VALSGVLWLVGIPWLQQDMDRVTQRMTTDQEM